MGEQLLGFLVKGPVRLDDFTAAAKAHIAARVQAAKGRLEMLKDSDVNDEDRPGPEDLVYGIADADVFDEEEALTILGDIAAIDPIHWVDSFLRVWCGDNVRDVACRDDPDQVDHQILFAGAATWGSEPAGTGYTMFQQAYQLGVLPVFGIR